jgi:hypothetical protein
MQEEEAYIPVEEVAVILGVSPRQAARYQDRVRTKRAGHRILYHRGDITAQAKLRGQGQDAQEAAKAYQQPKAEGVPASELIQYLREREAHSDMLQEQLHQATHRIGELEALLSQRLPAEDAAALRSQLTAIEADVHRLREELEQIRRLH